MNDKQLRSLQKSINSRQIESVIIDSTAPQKSSAEYKQQLKLGEDFSGFLVFLQRHNQNDTSHSSTAILPESGEVVNLLEGLDMITTLSTLLEECKKLDLNIGLRSHVSFENEINSSVSDKEEIIKETAATYAEYTDFLNSELAASMDRDEVYPHLKGFDEVMETLKLLPIVSNEKKGVQENVREEEDLTGKQPNPRLNIDFPKF